MIDTKKVKQELQEYVSEYGMDYYASNHFPLTSEAITELERLQKRETPMKPFKTDTGYHCEVCRKWLNIKYKHNFCPRCGQKLDWNEEEITQKEQEEKERKEAEEWLMIYLAHLGGRTVNGK